MFTLPEQLHQLAYQNKAIIYDQLFKTVAETRPTIAGDQRHLGAKIGLTAVLHTWGSSLVHHPHVHCIVTGGGLSEHRWVECRENFFAPVKVLSRYFRYRFLQALRS